MICMYLAKSSFQSLTRAENEAASPGRWLSPRCQPVPSPEECESVQAQGADVDLPKDEQVHLEPEVDEESIAPIRAGSISETTQRHVRADVLFIAMDAVRKL